MKSTTLARRAGGAALVGMLGAAALTLPVDAAAPGAFTGPSTTVDPYVIPAAPGVFTQSLLTVNDLPAPGGYGMVGIPDGLGAYLDGSGNVVVHMNHELRNNRGITRRHGQIGAFQSRIMIDPVTFKVRFANDLNTLVRYYDHGTDAYVGTAPAGESAAFNRFCSADQAEAGRFFNATSGNGTTERIFMAGEEAGAEGRAFGTLDNGVTTQLPRLGRFSFENVVPAHNATDRTVVAGMDDTFDGRLSIYSGTKKSGGGVYYNAGLTNGVLSNVKLGDVAVQTDAAFRAAYDVGDEVPFGLVGIDWDQTGAAQKAEADAKGAFRMNRIEDAAWDPSNPDDLYVTTTDGGEGSTGGGGGGLWRLRFADVENPQLGGTLTLLLDGTESIGFSKPDNLTVDDHGNVLIQEDPGGDDALARIVGYRISDGALGEIATFDPARFDPAVAGPVLITNDEESSGIIPADDLFGPGWYLFDAQVHTGAGLPGGTGAGTVDELQEHGQLLAMRVTDWAAVYGS